MTWTSDEIEDAVADIWLDGGMVGQVAGLLLEDAGMTQEEIAERLSVSQERVCYLIKKLRQAVIKSPENCPR